MADRLAIGAVGVVGGGQAVVRIVGPDGRFLLAGAVAEETTATPHTVEPDPALVQIVAQDPAAPVGADVSRAIVRRSASAAPFGIAVAADRPLDATATAGLDCLIAAGVDRLAALADRERLETRRAAGRRLRGLLAGYRLDMPFADQVSSRIDLLKELVEADGCFLRSEGRWRGLRRGGLVPRDALLLGDALDTMLADRTVWQTDCLPAAVSVDLPPVATGILAIRLDAAGRDLLVFSRRGDPDLPRRRVGDHIATPRKPGPRGAATSVLEPMLAPRRDGVAPARPWSDIDLETAEELRLLLQEAIFRIAERFRSIEAELDARSDRLARSEAESDLARGRDALTGLLNREALLAVMARWIDLDQAFALFSIDMDGLRAVNDAHGHMAGDRVLAAIAVRLQDHLRDGDAVARTGGDAFTVLAQPPLGTAALGILGRRLLTVLRQPIEIGGATVSLTAAVGIAVRDAEQTAMDLLRQADMALFRAKGRGGDGMAFFASDADETARGQAEIDRVLDRDGPHTGLKLLMHPVVPITTPPETPIGTFRQFEFLARWQVSDGTCLPPADFIPVAEQLGRIGSITDRVILSAAALLDRMKDPELRLAVNVSALDLHRAGWAVQTVDRLIERGIKPSAFDFDLSESALVRLTPAVQDNIAVLAAAGIGLALDDFGSGYSSLRVLETLPITAIKIDGRFLRQEREDRRRAILDSLIRLGHAFEKIVIAEGVETAEDVAVLRGLGCDLAQGFYWTLPMSPDSVFGAGALPEAVE